MRSVAVKLLIAGVIIALILWKVGVADVIDYARKVSPQGIALVLVLMILQLVLAALRQQGVATMFDSTLKLLASLQITFIGNFLSQTFISVVGGDVSRIWLLVRQGISAKASTCIVAFDRLIGVMAHHLLVLVALPWLLAIFDGPRSRPAVIAIAVVGTAAFAFLLAAGFVGARFDVSKWLPASIARQRAARAIMHVVTVKRAAFLHPGLGAVALMLSLVMAAMNGLIVYVLFHDIGVDISLFDCIIIVPLLMEVALLPITIGGWGLREAVMIVGFGAVGVSQPQALLCSVLFGLCGIATGLIGGVVWLSMRHDMAEAPKDQGLSERSNLTQ